MLAVLAAAAAVAMSNGVAFVSGATGVFPPGCVLDEAKVAALPKSQQAQYRKDFENRRTMEIYEGAGCSSYGPPLDRNVTRTTIFDGADAEAPDPIIVANRAVLVRPGRPNVACWFGALRGDHRAIVKCTGDGKGVRSYLMKGIRLHAVGARDGKLVVESAGQKPLLFDPDVGYLPD